MEYQIKEVFAEYENGKLKLIAVIWEDGGRIRGTFSNKNVCSGYNRLKEDEKLTDDLVQKVAGYGRYLSEEQKKKYFPGKKNWSR